MKQTIRTSGEVELDEKEVKEAVYLDAIKDPKRLIDSIKNYLMESHGYETTKISRHETKDGIIVRAEIKAVQNDIARALYSPTKEKGKKDSPHDGFKRHNTGFTVDLIDYLREQAAQGNKKVDFDKAFEDLKFDKPHLTRDKMMIYVNDKRLQKRHGFIYLSEGKGRPKSLSLSKG